MRIRDVEAYFDRLFPKERGCPWDNDGLMVCSDREKRVSKILTCLDVTFPAIEKAVAEGCDLIISHHPLIFSPITSVNEDSIIGQKILLLLHNNISLISLHTRFDGGENGLNERFAASLGITFEDVILSKEEPFIGGIGFLPDKMSASSFARLVSQSIQTSVRLYSAEMDIKRVGICCGSGKELVKPSLLEGADAFVGGDIPYHIAQEAVERGMSVIDCGHYGSEKAAPKIFRDLLFTLTSDWDVVAFEEELGGEIINFY